MYSTDGPKTTVEDASKPLAGNPGPPFLDTVQREFGRVMRLPEKMRWCKKSKHFHRLEM